MLNLVYLGSILAELGSTGLNRAQLGSTGLNWAHQGSNGLNLAQLGLTGLNFNQTQTSYFCFRTDIQHVGPIATISLLIHEFCERKTFTHLYSTLLNTMQQAL